MKLSLSEKRQRKLRSWRWVSLVSSCTRARCKRNGRFQDLGHPLPEHLLSSSSACFLRANRWATIGALWPLSWTLTLSVEVRTFIISSSCDWCNAECNISSFLKGVRGSFWNYFSLFRGATANLCDDPLDLIPFCFYFFSLARPCP